VSEEPILEVSNLQKFFPITSNSIFARVKGENKAVNGISFTLRRGETLGLVGESGCGKSTAGRTILKLYEPTSGAIRFNGEEITNYSTRKMKPLRTKMQIIFQDPYSSLNPRHSVGEIIGAAFTIPWSRLDWGRWRYREFRTVYDEAVGSGFDGTGGAKSRALQPIPA